MSVPTHMVCLYGKNNDDLILQINQYKKSSQKWSVVTIYQKSDRVVAWLEWRE